MICKTCGLDKLESEYYIRSDGKPDLHCKSCHLERQRLHRQKPEVRKRESAWKREYNKGRQDHRKTTHLMRTYGITADQYKEMLSNQKNKCMICSTAFDDTNVPCVDHCHSSGKVRGLLCHSCNRGIGQFREDKNLVLLAFQYLESYG